MTEQQQRQTVRGTVVKISSPKTIRVVSKVTKMHPVYRKRYTQNRHYLAHDPQEKAEVGQEVTLVSCRPVSKSKHWMIQYS